MMKPKSSFCTTLFAIACGLLFVAAPAVSGETGPPSSAAGGTGFSLSASYLHQFDTDIDGGGNFHVDRYFLRLNKAERYSDTLTLGLGCQYDLADYSFSDAVALTGSSPWDEVHALTLSASSIYSPDRDWKFFVAPSVGVAAASGADWGDSLVYGGIAWTLYRLNPAFAVGLGVGLFSRQDEFSGFPVIVLDWKISDRLRLSNPRNDGPTGPAGLELAYRLDDGAALAAGCAYRSLRFRLDDNGPAPDGVGEDSAVPLWIRFSTRVGAKDTLNLLAGAMAWGTFTVEDDHGNKIQERDYEVSPFLSATLSLNF